MEIEIRRQTKAARGEMRHGPTQMGEVQRRQLVPEIDHPVDRRRMVGLPRRLVLLERRQFGDVAVDRIHASPIGRESARADAHETELSHRLDGLRIAPEILAHEVDSTRLHVLEGGLGPIALREAVGPEGHSRPIRPLVPTPSAQGHSQHHGGRSQAHLHRFHFLSSKLLHGAYFIKIRLSGQTNTNCRRFYSVTYKPQKW